jgi:hypothetical protein
MKNLFFISMLILLHSTALFAQKVPTLTYSENYANEDLRGKELVIKGKLIAKDNEGGLLFFLEKTEDKFILTRVYNNSDSFFDKEAPKYVKDVIFYHLSPDLLKKLTFKAVENQKGYYQIDSQFNNIPYEQNDENKLKTSRHGYGESNDEGYELMGASTIPVGVFKSGNDFEKFKKELLK